MRCFSLKKGIAWDMLGKILLFVLFLLMALAILGMILARSTTILQGLKKAFGFG